MNDRNSLFPFPKSRGGLVALVTALAALVAAAMPGYLAYVDKTDDEAKKQAGESEDKADKAHDKAELAYELLRQKNEFQDVLIKRLFSRLDAMEGYPVGYGAVEAFEGYEDAEEPVAAPEPRSRRRASRRASGGGAEAVEDVMEELLALDSLDLDDEGVEAAEEPPAMTPPAQMQQQLPMNLNEAMKSR